MSISSPEPAGGTPLYAVGDVHGHAEALGKALAAAGLVDGDGHWTGGAARLWFLGDLTDRGPDGIGVIELIQRLDTEAAAAGGMVDTLLGNHEILLLGSRRFGDRLIELPAGDRSFESSWLLNGGQARDLAQLTDGQAEWLAGRSAMALADDHLLVHSDTMAYLEFGRSVPEINEAVRAELVSGDIDRWWECFRQLTRRHDFRGEDGAGRAGELLETLGGRCLVHGHSPIPTQLGVDPGEVREPYRYAGGLVVSLDGGLFAGGPCLVARLPLTGGDIDERDDVTAVGDSPVRESGTS